MNLESSRLHSLNATTWTQVGPLDDLRLEPGSDG